MTSSKSTKRALISSTLAILLCVAMLIGTTFAWFTDTASTGVNKIQAGNLDIELQMQVTENGETKWVKAEGKTLQFKKAAGHESEEVLWEPGCRYELPELRIVNKGNLALKYKITVNGVTGDAKLLEAIDFTAKMGTTEIALDSLKGAILPSGAAPTPAGEAVGATEPITIKGVMKTTAGNEYQGLSIDGIGITVVATQYTYENDSINDQYDKDAPLDFVPVSTAAELKTVFANAAAGGDVNVSLTGDIDFGTDKTLMIVDENSNIGDINIQANGHTVKNASNAVRVLQIANSDAERNITITGAKVVSESTTAGYNANENRGVQLYGVKNATVNLVNCNIEMKANDFAYAIKMINCDNVTLNLTGCTLTGANCIETNGGGETGNTINITDCVLNSNYPANSMPGQGIQDKKGNKNTFNIKNTTFNGTNAQPWESSDNGTTTINDLGGNVDNTTITKN